MISIMKDYLKILCSITVALITLAALLSGAVGLFSIVSGQSNLAESVLFPFAFAGIGFLLFGITGSVFWLVFIKAFGNNGFRPITRHIISASLSAAISWLTLNTTLGGGIEGLAETAVLLIPVVLVAACSLFWYWWLFLRATHKKAPK